LILLMIFRATYNSLILCEAIRIKEKREIF